MALIPQQARAHAATHPHVYTTTKIDSTMVYIYKNNERSEPPRQSNGLNFHGAP